MEQPTLSLALMGPFKATWQGEKTVELDFPTDKIRGLLAYLCLAAGRTRQHRYNREELAALLWSDWPMQDAKRNLRQSLYRLKQSLNKVSPELAEQSLATTRQHIELQPQWFDVDVWRWHSLLPHLQDASPAEEITLPALTEAIALYQGELLSGITIENEAHFDDWLRTQRTQLQTQLTTALVQAAQRHRDRCEFEQADLYLTQWLGLEPWNEEAHRERMLTLAMSGQRSAALAQYNICVANLLEEFQADPTDETAILYEQIHCEEIEPNQDAVQMDATTTQHHHGLRAPLLCLGRDQELREVESLLQASETRLLTILGGGGCGKTTLCTQLLFDTESKTKEALARRFPDGVFIIPLAGISQPEHIPSTLAQALGLATDAKGDLVKRCCDFLRHRRALLFWDNFEHILDGKSQVKALLQEAKETVHLVTSRVPLELSAERKYPLKGLALPDAIALFAHWAHKVDPQFVDDEESDAIHAICQTLSGVPLAVELAANWVQMIDCQEIHEELQRDLSLMHTEWSDFPAHHRSMHTIFEHTWGMLSERLQQVFASLTTFRGSFDLKAARAITGASLGELTSLWERALLQRPRKGRFAMQVLLQHFGREKLSQHPEATSFQTAHTSYFLSLLERHQDGFVGRYPHRARQLLEQELDNIRSAWHSAIDARDTDSLINTANGLSLLYQNLGLYEESEELFAQAHELCEQCSVPFDESAPLLMARAWSLIQLGRHEYALNMMQMRDAETLKGPLAAEYQRLLGHGKIVTGTYEDAITALTKAAAIYEQYPNVYGQSDTRSQLGRVYWRKSDYERATDYLQAGLLQDRKTGYRHGIAQKLNLLGFTQEGQCTPQQSLDYLQQALHIVEELGHRVDQARYLNNIGILYKRQARYDEAIIHYKRAHELFETLGMALNASSCLLNMGVIHWHLKQFEDARDNFQQVLFIQRELGEDSKLGITLGNLGKTYAELGEHRRAIECLNDAIELETSMGHVKEVGRAKGLLAEIYAQQGEYDVALEHLDAGIAIIREISYLLHLCWLLVSRAEILHAQGRTAEAIAQNEEALDIATELQRDEIIERCEQLAADMA